MWLSFFCAYHAKVIDYSIKRKQKGRKKYRNAYICAVMLVDKKGWLAISPLLVFLVVYLITSLLAGTATVCVYVPVLT